MAESEKDKIIAAAAEILAQNPDGVRKTDLINEVCKTTKCKKQTVVGNLWTLQKQIQDNVSTKFQTRKERGGAVFFYLRANNDAPQADAPKSDGRSSRIEEKFYASFAKYLEYGDGDEERLGECSKAVAWGGGSKSNGKWGTPDVVGVFKPDRKADVQFQHEIVSVEIKIGDKRDALITGFGQACAYRLFSHKVYLAIPAPKSESDSTEALRIEALCHVFGIGLVHFNAKTPEKPDYKKILRAQAHSPDMFYVNEFIKGELSAQLYGD